MATHLDRLDFARLLYSGFEVGVFLLCGVTSLTLLAIPNYNQLTHIPDLDLSWKLNGGALGATAAAAFTGGFAAMKWATGWKRSPVATLPQQQPQAADVDKVVYFRIAMSVVGVMLLIATGLSMAIAILLLHNIVLRAGGLRSCAQGDLTTLPIWECRVLKAAGGFAAFETFMGSLGAVLFLLTCFWRWNLKEGCHSCWGATTP